MHLADGVLNLPTLVVSAVVSAGGVALGLRRMTPQTLPLAALFAAVFFLAGTLRVPIGLGSVHLVLNGLIGLLLGWLAFPVILVALLLQALLFSVGGIASLGANTLLLAAPAVLAHHALHPMLGQPSASPRRLLLVGAAASAVGILGAVLLAAALLWATGGSGFLGLIFLLAATQLPVAGVDAIVSALALASLGSALPRVLQRSIASPR